MRKKEMIGLALSQSLVGLGRMERWVKMHEVVVPMHSGCNRAGIIVTTSARKDAADSRHNANTSPVQKVLCNRMENKVGQIT